MRRRKELILIFSAAIIFGLVIFVFNLPSSLPRDHHNLPLIKPTRAPNYKAGMTEQEPRRQIKPAEPQPTERVHLFYYPWYSNPEKDKANKWNHWNHNIIPHWSENIKKQFPYDIKYAPPDDIGSCFYPARGPYASADRDLIREHFKELTNYTVVVSWWGRGKTDGEGMNTNDLMDILFQVAEEESVRLAFHLEPYPGRTAASVRADIQYFFDKWGQSPALYRDPERGNRPLVYIYDSYLIPSVEWRKLFDRAGKMSVRGTPLDIIALGLWVEQAHATMIDDAHFDGFYTYFASNTFVYGSNPQHWEHMASFAREKKWIFSISVGPGYDDTRIRPWNSQNVKKRNKGAYYDSMWSSALATKPTYVSVTSYNEWMEGTQIEAAVPKQIEKTIYDGKPYTYQDYGDLPPNFYMDATYRWAEQFVASFTPNNNQPVQ